MRPEVVALVCSLHLPAAITAAESGSGSVALLGTWRIDLRPAPAAEPYYQTLTVESVADGRLTGSFYGTPVRDGRINAAWSDVCFAFVTEDGSGEYHTAGVLRDGRLEGTTLSIGRGFLMPWRAIPEYEATVLSRDETLEEIDLLWKTLESVHPGLDRYVDEAALSARRTRLEQAADDGTSDVELYREISLALAAIRCGHTRVEAPEALTEYRRRVPTHLPFRFRLIDGRMIVDVADAGARARGLRRGQEIVSINGVPTATLVGRIAPTVPVDGFADSIRPSRLDSAYEFADSGFDHYLPIFEGFRDDFTLGVIDPGGAEPHPVTVLAIGSERWSAFAAPSPRNFADSIRVERLDATTALLDVGSFINYRNTVDPVERLAPIFRDLRTTGVEHLVLDLRRNGGGSSDAAWALARFLLEEPIRFEPPLVRNYRYDESLRRHLRTWEENALNMPDEAFTRRPDGWYELRPEVAGRATTLAPHPDRFTGRVTILIGPANASGTTMLIATLRETLGASGRLRTVGEPTGGSIAGPTAGVIFFLELPRSGITVNIPALRERTPAVTDDADTNAGLVPDLLVRPTVDDFLAGRDPVLEAARRR